MKSIFFAYLHPDQTPGGQQKIAYAQYEYASAKYGKENALFIASNNRSPISSSGKTAILQVSETEFLYQNNLFDADLYTNHDFDGMQELLALIMSFKPDLIHIHHFYGFGVDFFLALRKKIQVKTIFTIHDHLSICENSGSLLQNNTNKICYKVNAVSCSKCLPKRFDYFILRNRVFKEFFRNCDVILAVSEFTKTMISDTLGIDNIKVVPNGPFLNLMHPYTPTQANNGRVKPIRLVYFGQISATKGLKLLLNCIERIISDKSYDAAIQLDVWGSFDKDDSYIKKIRHQARTITGKKHSVVLHSEFSETRVPAMLAAADIAIIPSLCPESYCLTADEALYAGKITLCANFPSLAERYQCGGQLICFEMGNEDSLYDALTTAIDNIRIACSVEVARSYPDETHYLKVVESQYKSNKVQGRRQ